MKITIEYDEGEPARGTIETDQGPVITFTGLPDSVLEPEPMPFSPDEVFQFGSVVTSARPSFRYRLDVTGIVDVTQYADASLMPRYIPPGARPCDCVWPHCAHPETCQCEGTGYLTD